jgi:transposase-like protein
VVAQAKRRRYTTEYKQRILAEADEARESGGISALLRREGLYSSALVTWRRQRATGILQSLSPQRRGPKVKRDAAAIEMQQLRRENLRLSEELRKADIVIDIQKKSGRSAGPRFPGSRPEGEELMDAVTVLSSTVGIEPACVALGIARASYYRQRPMLGPSSFTQPAVECIPRPTPARALCADERLAVRAVLNSERFQDCSPAAINATLLDEGQYLCSTEPCTASWKKTEPHVSGATSLPTRGMRSRDCLPPRPTRCWQTSA